MRFLFFQIIRESLESYRGSRSEPPGVYGLRKQVTEAGNGPWNSGERMEFEVSFAETELFVNIGKEPH